MTAFVPTVMFGWIPFILAVFALLPPRRAVILGFIVAWLVMPVAVYEIKGFPDYTKMTAICLGVLGAAAVFDFRRFLRFRPTFVDVPMGLWCAAPLLTSLSNGLGVYNGISGMAQHVIGWGAPYILGRVYFRGPQDLKDLAVGIFLGGLAYVPFCIYETVYGPELHNLFYGFHQQPLDQAERFGGWRPVVFLHHGLMVGVWMASASVIGIHLLMSDNRGPSLQLMQIAFIILLVLACLLLKSANAWVLLALGIVLLMFARRQRSSAIMWGLIALIVLYVCLRSTGIWSGDALVKATARFDEDRSRSLEFRFNNESVLAQKARERLVFGWDGWGRHKTYYTDGYRVTVSDSLWIIAFGKYGIVGLVSVMASLLVPVMRFLTTCPARHWFNPLAGPPAALACVLLLYMIDNLANAMVSPVFMLVAGGLSAADFSDLSKEIDTVTGAPS